MFDITKSNISKKEINKLIKFDEETLVKYIYNEYYINQHLSVLKLEELFNYSRHTFYRLFKKYNLETRNFRDMKMQYSCNSNYFETIDTEEKAYWLGFMYADGYIQKESTDGCSKKVGISLSEKDKEHLEKFKECINSNTPIHTYNVSSGYNINSIYCRIILTEPKMAEDLIDKGCFEHKTNIIKFPTEQQVPKHLLKHFIRGYFDGDGSLKQRKSKYKTGMINYDYVIAFIGTDDFLKGIQDYLLENNIITRKYDFTKRKNDQTVSAFEFGGNIASLRFCEFIYGDAKIFLDRKYQRYINLKEMIKNKNDSKNFEKICSVCGISCENNWRRWVKDGEYNNKILCNKHYTQLLKHGVIKPDYTRKEICDVCEDRHSRKYSLWLHEGELLGKTLCKKHYEQMNKYNKIIDETQAKHKNKE